MITALHRFCILAIFCGAALRLAPEGSVRRIMSVLVSAVLLISIFRFFGIHPTEELFRGLGKQQEYERRFAAQAQERRQGLDRLVIEEELRTYILNKASERGLQITGIRLEMRWQTEGCWLPWSVTMTGSGSESERRAFQRELEAELGVPSERQQWVDVYGLEEY